MRITILLTLMVALLCAVPADAESSKTTPASLVSAYDGLADTILGAREAEEGLVRSILDEHYRAAKRAKKRGDWDAVGAQMVLFASEGDNAVAGVRKRLLEGGHHFNQDDAEEGGKFEPGFVVVGRQQKKKMLAASKALLLADNDEGREAAWEQFQMVADKVMK